jgi:nucleotide-binding universal stress UspA family protein
MYEAHTMGHAPGTAHGPGAVVVGVDGTPRSHLALLWAAHEASLRGVLLRVVHVNGDRHPHRLGRTGSEAEHEAQAASAGALVDEEVGAAREGHPTLAVQGEVLEGPGPEALVEAAEAAGLLVVGARRHGPLARHRPGAVAGHCMRRANCPVVVVHGATEKGEKGRSPSPDARREARRIVVGIDGSPASDLALQWALEEGALRHVPVSAVHAWQPPPVGEFVVPPGEASERLAGVVVDDARAIAAASDRESGFDAAVKPGAPVPVLVDESRDSALLVIGGRGHRWFHEGVVGIVATRCADEAECPVVVVSPGFRREVVMPAAQSRRPGRTSDREAQVLPSRGGST